PEMIKEMAQQGIDFEAGNRARRGNFEALPRKRRNSREIPAAKWKNYEKEDYEYFNKNTKKNYWEEEKKGD
uniref:BUD13 homolog n=1 Tax=Meloidogyne javanica TaxID=6303 RepID=A0A915LI29_MELJA